MSFEISDIGIEKQQLNKYRVVCMATWPASDRGCSGCGRWGESTEEAEQLAEEAEWQFVKNEWICPAHIEGLLLSQKEGMEIFGSCISRCPEKLDECGK